MLAEQALKKLAADSFPNELVVVAHHPYRYDTLALMPDDSIRMARHPHEPGKPALIIDDNLVALPEDPAEYLERINSFVAAARTDSAFLDLAVDGSVSSAVCSVFVTAVKLDDAAPNPNLRLVCIITEDSMFDMLGGRNDRVPRKYMPDVTGRPFEIAVRFDTLRDTLVFTPQNVEVDKLRAAVFVEDVVDYKIEQAVELPRFRQ